MIVSNLAGGLGNQMFQYACARTLALDLTLPLKFTVDTFRQFDSYHQGPELERVFGLKLDVPDHVELRRLVGVGRTHPKVRRLIAQRPFSWLGKSKFLSEPDFRYWSKLRPLAIDGAYLHGYWQSEKYFSDHADLIRADFTPRAALSGKNLALAQMIANRHSISIHVRRGDYVSNAKTLATHGTCSPEYYFMAIEIILQKFPGARLIAFSDDPQWVSQVLLPRYPELVLVDHNNGLDSYNDMRLMSMCQHHIIANSSFSWWGAWLNPSQDKVVIAPRDWFLKVTDDRDLIPTSWIRI